jgi:signal transduction histidine kinase
VAGRLAAVVEVARADVLALSASAAAQGVLRSRAAGGIDPVDGSSEAAWRARLARAMVGELAAKPDYLQFRLIGREADGRELVRVDRSGAGPVPVVTAEADLQAKGGRPYFGATLALAPGEISVSPIELNRERDGIEVPHRPVLRVATPVSGPDGRAAGILVINIDMARVFAAMRAAAADRDLLVLNAEGQYLLGPEAGLDFGFELGRPAGLADRFPSQAALSRRAGLATDRNGERFALALEPMALGGRPEIYVALTVPYRQFAALADAAVRAMVIGALFATGSAALLALAMARSLARPIGQITGALQSFRGEALPALPRRARGEIGRLSEAVGVMAQDIVEKSATLKRSNAELEQFAYSVSHDLKGPMTTIAGLLDIGLEDLKAGDSERCRATLADALEICRRNASKIEAVLDIARAGTDPVPVVAVDLAAELRLIWHDLTGTLTAPPELALTIEGLPAFVTERQTLLTIFENLLSNAIRYCDRGKPDPWVRVRGRIGEAGLEIEIADNGIGIPAEHHARVFSMFNRFSEQSGSGLGLSLVKKHVDRLKGTIGFESGGDVTRFTLSLPAACPQEAGSRGAARETVAA